MPHWDHICGTDHGTTNLIRNFMYFKRLNPFTVTTIRIPTTGSKSKTAAYHQTYGDKENNAKTCPPDLPFHALHERA